MPKPPLRPCHADFDMEEEEGEEYDVKIFAAGRRPPSQEELSRITEGSREGDSVATSAYFSAVSGSMHQGLVTLASSLKLAQQQRLREPQRENGTAAIPTAAGGRSGRRVSAGVPSDGGIGERSSVPAPPADAARGRANDADRLANRTLEGADGPGPTRGDALAGSPDDLKRMVKA